MAGAVEEAVAEAAETPAIVLKEEDVAEAPAVAGLSSRCTPSSLIHHVESCDLGHNACAHCLFAAGGAGICFSSVPDPIQIPSYPFDLFCDGRLLGQVATIFQEACCVAMGIQLEEVLCFSNSL
jgi:hypothetical protein